MIIKDRYGVEQDWDWLVANYGPLVIHSGFTGPGYRVVELQENADLKAPDNILAANIILVKVLDAAGSPVDGKAVAWYWPDAPAGTTCGPINGLPEGMIRGRYEMGHTNANGDTAFAMGGGAYYFPPAIGPHAVWMCSPTECSEVIYGLGMLGGTNHYSIWPTFQWVEDGQPPPDCPWDEIFVLLDGLEKDLTQAKWRANQGLQKVTAIRALRQGQVMR